MEHQIFSANSSLLVILCIYFTSKSEKNGGVEKGKCGYFSCLLSSSLAIRFWISYFKEGLQFITSKFSFTSHHLLQGFACSSISAGFLEQTRILPRMSCCDGTGPGFATPLDAYNNGPREKILYTTSIYTGQWHTIHVPGLFCNLVHTTCSIHVLSIEEKKKV